MNPRSKTLTAVAIVSILLGVLGVLSSGYGLAMVAVQPKLQQMQVDMQVRMGTPQKMIEEQKAMTDRIQAAARPYQPWGLALTGVKLVLMLGLIAGGARLLIAGAHGLLFWATVTVIPFEIGVTAFGVLVQMATMSVMRESMAGMSAGPAGGQAIVDASLTAGLIIGFTIAAGWLLLKLGFFGWAAWTLKQKPVESY